MATEHVTRVAREDIPRLVKRLENHGTHSAKTRCLLHLLNDGVNTSPFETFTSGETDQELVVATVARPLPGLAVLDVFAEETAAGRRRLAALLRAPPLRRLWDGPVRADGVPAALLAELRRAAAETGSSCGELHEFRLFARPAGSPPVAEQAGRDPGVSVLPLDATYLEKLQQHWPYAAHVPDVVDMLRDCQREGLSAGVFTSDNGTPPQDDGPVSWAMVNRNGGIGFLHTEAAHRGRGFAAAVVARLTRLCEQRGYPALACTADGDTTASRLLGRLGYVSGHRVLWTMFGPSANGAAAGDGRDGHGESQEL